MHLFPRWLCTIHPIYNVWCGNCDTSNWDTWFFGSNIIRLPHCVLQRTIHKRTTDYAHNFIESFCTSICHFHSLDSLQDQEWRSGKTSIRDHVSAYSTFLALHFQRSILCYSPVRPKFHNFRYIGVLDVFIPSWYARLLAENCCTRKESEIAIECSCYTKVLSQAEWPQQIYDDLPWCNLRCSGARLHGTILSVLFQSTVWPYCWWFWHEWPQGELSRRSCSVLLPIGNLRNLNFLLRTILHCCMQRYPSDWWIRLCNKSDICNLIDGSYLVLVCHFDGSLL